MVLGVLIGKFLPGIPAYLNRFEYARVSIPMAILIWLMIYGELVRHGAYSIPEDYVGIKHRRSDKQISGIIVMLAPFRPPCRRALEATRRFGESLNQMPTKLQQAQPRQPGVS